MRPLAIIVIYTLRKPKGNVVCKKSKDGASIGVGPASASRPCATITPPCRDMPAFIITARRPTARAIARPANLILTGTSRAPSWHGSFRPPRVSSPTGNREGPRPSLRIFSTIRRFAALRWRIFSFLSEGLCDNPFLFSLNPVILTGKL